MTTFDEAAEAAASSWYYHEGEETKAYNLAIHIVRNIAPLLEAKNCEIAELRASRRELADKAWQCGLEAARHYVTLTSLHRCKANDLDALLSESEDKEKKR